MSEWIEWKGGECPVPANTWVHVQCRNGYEPPWAYFANRIKWDDRVSPWDIVAYRVVEEDASDTANILTPNPKPDDFDGLEACLADSPDPTDVGQILEARGKRYGKFDSHARVTQNIKRAMYDSPNWRDLPDDMREALEMVAHKVGRILNGDPNYADSWVDIGGYVKLVTDRLD